MDGQQTMVMVEERMATTASASWSYAVSGSYWFGFTYLTPAVLAGREVRMD